MSTLAVSRPAPAATGTLPWALSDGAFENHFVTSAAVAAVWLTDEAMRQHRRDQTSALSVHLHDPFLGVLWDATADVAAVFTATGWPQLNEDTLHLRAAVIGMLTDILVSDDTPTDAPAPGFSDPHTYALVCR